jgi:WD40 repeat protein
VLAEPIGATSGVGDSVGADTSLNWAAFSPSGTQVLTASDDGTARVWDVASGKLVETLSGPGRAPVYNAVFSRDGKSIVTCSGSSDAIWSTMTGEQLTEVQYGTSLSDCEFSPDGREIVTAGGDGQTRIFSTELAGGLAHVERIAEHRSAQPLTAAEAQEFKLDAG